MAPEVTLLPEPRPVPGPRPGPGPEIEALRRRVEHLAIAVDNLHAAGLHEPAEKLAGEVVRKLHARLDELERRGPAPAR